MTKKEEEMREKEEKEEEKAMTGGERQVNRQLNSAGVCSCSKRQLL